MANRWRFPRPPRRSRPTRAGCEEYGDRFFASIPLETIKLEHVHDIGSIRSNVVVIPAAVSPDALSELFSGFGPVVIRRMFGGAGIYADGLMFALEADGSIYLKADESTVASFKGEGCGPFVFATKAGKKAVMSYWRLPDRLYDDVEEFAVWARAAHGAAKRAQRVKPPRKKRSG